MNETSPVFERRKQQKKLQRVARLFGELDAAATTRRRPARRRTTLGLSRA